MTDCLRCGARNWGYVDGELDLKLLKRKGCTCLMTFERKPMGVPARGKKKSKKKTTKKSTSSSPSVSGGELGVIIPGGPTVHVQVGKTINLGDYETLRVDYGETWPVNEGESHDDVREKATVSMVRGMTALIEDMQATFG